MKSKRLRKKQLKTNWEILKIRDFIYEYGDIIICNDIKVLNKINTVAKQRYFIRNIMPLIEKVRKQNGIIILND